ncbi:MAG: hypothetical protein M3R01_09830 [Actinomycetota bacterium]|nr:hypothetical protein [Acidimicrobiia bacterium]MDQ3147208.1 hypothetical protein [Actinomycetota bacterium]
MPDITVTPETWQFVDFDGQRIVTVASRLAETIGLDRPVRIEVDETTPLGRAWMLSLDPLTLAVESGAFEDPKRPRQLSERHVADVLGLLLFRARDRLDPDFGEVPPDDDLNLAQSTAWDAYAVGRFARLGYPVQRQRRLYHFRNRHGFSDVGDAAFERLWSGDGLRWADILAVCEETAAVRTPVA